MVRKGHAPGRVVSRVELSASPHTHRLAAHRTAGGSVTILRAHLGRLSGTMYVEASPVGVGCLVSVETSTSETESHGESSIHPPRLVDLDGYANVECHSLF